MPVIRLVRRLRDAPGGAPVRTADGSAIDLPEGTVVTVLVEDPSGWTQVKAIFGEEVVGWVSSDGIAEGEEFSLSKAVFAAQCVESGVTYGANAYYLMTLALARTNIKSFSLGRPDGLVGPFGLTSSEWEVMRDVPEWLIDFSESQITLWTAQAAAFASSVYAMHIRVADMIDKEPSIRDLYFAQTFGSSALKQALSDPGTVFSGIVEGLNSEEMIKEGVEQSALQHRVSLLGGGATAQQTLEAIDELLKPHFEEAVDHVRPAADKFAAALTSAGVAVAQPEAALDFTSPYLNTAMKRTNAVKITAAFAASGYGAIAQIAAVANAIGESSLNHKAANTSGEDSHGLFQLNRNGGVGSGHSVSDLQDAGKNIRIMLNHILEPHNKNARQRFLTTNKLTEAVQVFVYEFERPADKAGASAERAKIAKSIKM